MQYRIENDTLIPAPLNYLAPSGWIMNFNHSPELMTRYGFTLTEEDAEEWRRQHPAPEPPAPDTKDFEAACQQFREICSQIGTAIGDPDFKGGFDEMQEFAQSPVYGTIQGLKLGLAWSAANENCKYEGQRIGLGQPAWWYYAWQTESSDSGE